MHRQDALLCCHTLNEYCTVSLYVFVEDIAIAMELDGDWPRRTPAMGLQETGCLYLGPGTASWLTVNRCWESPV